MSDGRAIMRKHIGPKTYDAYVEWESLSNRLGARGTIDMQDLTDFAASLSKLTGHMLVEVIATKQELAQVQQELATHKS